MIILIRKRVMKLMGFKLGLILNKIFKIFHFYGHAIFETLYLNGRVDFVMYNDIILEFDLFVLIDKIHFN